MDKSGNGSAVIRFLPASKNEELPFVRLFSHAFKGLDGSWYIENSLTTLGQDDPVSSSNSELWNSGSEANKELARSRKRKLSYISNIYIVKDPSNPENEGTVRLYRYGKKIFDKLSGLLTPEFDDKEPVNPFDLWKGATLRLRIRQVAGFRNYDASEFDQPSPLFKNEDDANYEWIWKEEHPLLPFLAPDQFKSYDELKTKLNRVIGGGNQSSAVEEPVPKKALPISRKKPAAELIVEDDDPDMDFLKKLQEEDA